MATQHLGPLGQICRGHGGPIVEEETAQLSLGGSAERQDPWRPARPLHTSVREIPSRDRRVLPRSIREKLGRQRTVDFQAALVACRRWGEKGIKQSNHWQLDEWLLVPWAATAQARAFLPGEDEARRQAPSVRLTGLHRARSLLMARWRVPGPPGDLNERIDGPVGIISLWSIFPTLLSLSWRRPGLGDML